MLMPSCATRKTTTPNITPPSFVHVTDVSVVHPGEEFVEGSGIINTTTNKFWVFTKLGLKATIVKACDTPNYATGLMETP